MSESIALAALVGIDWADQYHEVSLQASESSTVEHSRLSHTPEALGEWIAGLRRRFRDQPVGIAVETSRGPLVHALLDHDCLVLYPINPRALKRFREAFSPSGAKDDVPDADLLRELLVKHRDRLQAWVPEDVETRALRRLVEHRRKLVDLQTRLTQQVTAALKDYFPQALSWTGGDLSTAMAHDFLLRWPTLEAVQRARPATLRQFYRSHHCRSAERIEARLQEMQQATPLTRDRAVIETTVLLVHALARQLQTLSGQIARFDTEIAARFAAHADAALFESLPGSGAALAPRLLVAFGSDRARFHRAADVQALAGIAPVTQRSGRTHIVHWRWAAPTFMRQSFHEFANQSIRFSAWARRYYALQRARGHGHHAAVRALAFKWIRIIWRCWQDRTPYNETRYLESLVRRCSPSADTLTTCESATAT